MPACSSLRAAQAVLAAGLHVPTVVLPARTPRSAAFVSDVRQKCNATCLNFANVQSTCRWQGAAEPQLHHRTHGECVAKQVVQLAKGVQSACASVSASAKAATLSCLTRLAAVNFPATLGERVTTADLAELARQQRFVASFRQMVMNMARDGRPQCIALSDANLVRCPTAGGRPTT